MSKKFLNITIPPAEQKKYEQWVKRQTKENKVQCQNLMVGTIMKIAHLAISFAPTGKGAAIKNSYRKLFSGDKLSGAVYNIRHYAPYVEFGTGRYAAKFTAMNPDIKEYAMTFFVSGKGRTKAQPSLFPAVRIAVREMYVKLRQMGFK